MTSTAGVFVRARAAVSAAALVCFVIGLAAPAAAQAEGCQRCGALEEVLGSIRCGDCKDEPCEKCSNTAASAMVELACTTCDGKACADCETQVKGQKCAYCVMAKQAEGKVYCGDDCAMTGEACEKCHEVRKTAFAAAKVCVRCHGKKTEPQKNVTVYAAKIGSELKGWFKFKIAATNANADGLKTVKGKVRLGKDGAAGEGTIYLEKILPGETKQTVITVKETGEWSDFEVVLEKVFDF